MTTDPLAPSAAPPDLPACSSSLATWRDIPLGERKEEQETVVQDTGMQEAGEPTHQLKSERGAVMAEYGLLIAMIALFVIGSVLFLTGTIQGIFSDTTNSLNTGQAPSMMVPQP